MHYDGWNQPSGTTGDQELVIAVLDTGVDHNNPDLKNKMWSKGDLGLPGGEHGINYGGYTPEQMADTSDPNGHGTHCAGIIGAEWGNGGVSGTSQNAKIMALRYGNFVSTVLACYDYMASAIDLQVNLKAVNCSFTSSGSPKSLDMAVEKLGKMGMISVYGSANSATDNDKTGILSSTFIDNPYAIVVDAANAYGLLAAYSCYGQRTTDIVAPGSRILSTWPTDQAFYYPEFSDSNLFYEGFENAGSLQFYTDADPAKGKACGEITGEKVYNGQNSLKLQGTKEGNTVYSQPVDLMQASGFDASGVYRFSLNIAGEDGHGNGQAEIKVRLTDGTFAPLNGNVDNSFARGRDGGFNGLGSGASQILPENTDYMNFQLCLTLRGIDMTFPNGHGEYVYQDNAVYIDNLGVGSTTLPYNYSDGTSMATPMVTGAVAVLAERYQDDSAAKRAARTIGSVTKYNEFKDLCVSDGFIDLSQSVTANPYPVVNAADITDDTVTIDGYFFGESPAVTIGGKAAQIQSKETAGDGGQRLVVARPAVVSGMARVSVTSYEKGEGHQSYDFGEIKDVAYFENTLPLPEDSAFFDTEAYQMVGFGDYLYCIPHFYNFPEIVTMLWRFNVNTQTWDQVALPEDTPMINATAVVWQDKLLIYSHDIGTVGMILTYDGSTWTQTPGFSGKDLPSSATLVNNDGQLLAVGGASSNAVDAVNLERHTLTPMGNTLRTASGPLVSAGHGQLIVSGGLEAGNQNGTLPGVERLTLDNGVYTPAELDMTGINTGNLSGFASAAVKDGFMLVGPETSDGATDAYTLGLSGGLMPYEKRVDNGPLANPSAAAYKGQFYVLARTYTTDSNFIFKSTAVETNDPVNPDEPVNPDTPANPDNTSGQNGNAGTGIAGGLPMAGMAALLLLSAAGIVVWSSRKRQNR
nr:S8 family serine peptidase [Eubacterium sp. 1001713B170207_170306_E7]